MISSVRRQTFAFMDDVTLRIETRWVCIATNRQTALAALVSSYFRESEVYFAVFEFPTIPTPYSPIINYDTDGAFARILGTRAAVWINNSVAAIQPDGYLLLGLTESEKSYLLPLLPAAKLIEVNTVENIPEQEPFAPAVDGPLRCSATEMQRGLLQAKVSGKSLLIDESAPHLPSTLMRGGRGVVVIESAGGIEDVIAINYAFAICADVVLVPAVEKSAVDSLARQLDTWSRDRSSVAFAGTRHEITARIKGIDFSRYQFATFFTVGLPYGLVLKNLIPCSHVLKGPYCGEFIANAITEELSPITFDTALLFSPQLFASEETADVAETLHSNNYNVKLLVGGNATVKQLDYYGELFPYDVLHICSHGGETTGYYSILEFADRLERMHRLEFYEVVGFSPAGGDMVTVESKAIFAVLDGFQWRSEPLKSYPKYVFEDLFKALKGGRDQVKRRPVREAIAMSCHIQCSDSIHQGAFQNVAGFGHPVIFNNTCSSTHQMAGMFMAAGARCYIGTLWAIENVTAIKAAEVFYRKILEQGRVIDAFAAMNEAIKNTPSRDVYILWGLHISSMRRPSQRSDDKVFAALLESYSMWMRKIATARDPEVKRNSIKRAEFISAEILRLFTPARIQMHGFDPPVLDEQARNLPAEPDEPANRTPSELIISTEVRRPNRDPAEA